MPIYEYLCETCGKTSEFLVRSSDTELKCSCGSNQMKRILSAFAVSEGNSGQSTGCSDGSCGIPSSPCASGMCGL